MKTISDLIDTAIMQEGEAQALYRQGAKLVKDKKAKHFFIKLADEEIRHEATLVNIKETQLYDLSIPIKDTTILKKAGQSHGKNKPQEIATIKSAADVLKIALKREYTAEMFYKAAGDAVKNKELKTLFKNLAKEEKVHHRDVEKLYNLFMGKMGKEL